MGWVGRQIRKRSAVGKPLNVAPPVPVPPTQTPSPKILSPYDNTSRRTFIHVRYGMIKANDIFGMVGRCGGGYNTLWADWSPKGRACRELVMKEFEEELDKICGHYSRLEESILKEGIRNPLIVTCGLPLWRNIKHLPPEMMTKSQEQLLLLEGGTGGSRLWIAQKYNLEVPCIINDQTRHYRLNPLISNTQDAKAYYKDDISLKLTPRHGLHEVGTLNKPSVHLEEKWHNSQTMDQIRAPIWYKAMKRQGYDLPMTPQFKELIKGIQ